MDHGPTELLLPGEPMLSWGALGRAFQQVKGGELAPLLSSDEATSGVLCPVLGSTG